MCPFGLVGWVHELVSVHGKDFVSGRTVARLKEGMVGLFLSLGGFNCSAWLLTCGCGF